METRLEAWQTTMCRQDSAMVLIEDTRMEAWKSGSYLSQSQREKCEIDTIELVPAAVPIHSEISTREKQRKCRRNKFIAGEVGRSVKD